MISRLFKSAVSGKPALSAAGHHPRFRAPRGLVVLGPSLVIAMLVLGSLPASVAAAGFPTAPSNLSVTGTTPTSITLSWVDNSNNENGFNIHAWSSADGSLAWTLDGVVAANVTTFTDTTGAFPGTYYYYVCAFIGGNESCTTGYVTGTTAVTPVALPIAPSNIGVWPPAPTSLTFHWRDLSNNETGFRIYHWSAADGSVWKLVGTAPADPAFPAPNFESFTDVGLATGATYYYYACAFNSAGQSCASGNVWGTTTAVPPPATLPNAPLDLFVDTETTTSLTFHWADTSGDETAFRIYHWSGADGSVWKLAGTTPANTTSFVDTGLSPNATYWYYACAVNSAGENCDSASADIVWDTTLPLSVVTPPVAPTNTSVTGATLNSLTFNWADKSTNEDSFRIYHWSAADGSVWKLAGLTVANTTSFTDVGLATGATYYYYACAFNSAGQSCAPGNVWGTTLVVTLPAAPTNGTGSINLSSSSIQFSWTDNSTNEDGFRIYHWSAADGSVWKLAGTKGANVTSLTENGLSSNSTYYYYVCAYNSAGQSCAPGYGWGQTAP
jgi:hypothetical protein